jgi:perosamine synthetase
VLRTLPPTAAPVPFRYLLYALLKSIGGERSESHFRDEIKAYFQARHAFLLSSGKAALYLALVSLQQISNRREIIIPAYSSFCLASAAARSGLRIKLCDIDRQTLDFDLNALERLADHRTLCMIPVHNYGLACDMEAIRERVSGRGTYILEDAAQGAGASLRGNKLGIAGDLGILSFGRGKNFCALGGGAILTNNDTLASVVTQEVEKLSKPTRSSEAKLYVIGAALGLFLHPERYAIPSALPFLHLGANVFDPNFKTSRLPLISAAVGRRTLADLDHENEIRIQNACFYRSSLISNPRLLIPTTTTTARSVYLRFPVFFKKKLDREKALHLLTKERLGASRSYPTTLAQIPGFRNSLILCEIPNANWVAERILTLPTHRYVREMDRTRIVNLINTATKQDYNDTISH